MPPRHSRQDLAYQRKPLNAFFFFREQPKNLILQQIRPGPHVIPVFGIGTVMVKSLESCSGDRHERRFSSTPLLRTPTGHTQAGICDYDDSRARSSALHGVTVCQCMALYIREENPPSATGEFWVGSFFRLFLYCSGERETRWIAYSLVDSGTSRTGVLR